MIRALDEVARGYDERAALLARFPEDERARALDLMYHDAAGTLRTRHRLMRVLDSESESDSAGAGSMDGERTLFDDFDDFDFGEPAGRSGEAEF